MGFISSKLLISDNDWFRSSLPVSAEWKALEYSNGIFVALASYGPYATPVPQRAAYSYNGTKWFAGTINQATGWRSIAYGNGRFVAVGYVNNHDLNINGIVYSDNGANWTAVNTQKQRWQSVAFGNGRFVAASVEDAATGPGVLAYSNNGITWTILSAPTSASGWSSVAYGDGKFIAVKRYTSDMAYSYDGITWTSFSPSPSSHADAYKIKYDGMKFVGLLNGGNMNISNRLPYSYNGLDWGYLGIPQGRWTDTTSNGEKLICIQASSSLILSK